MKTSQFVTILVFITCACAFIIASIHENTISGRQIEHLLKMQNEYTKQIHQFLYDETQNELVRKYE